MNIIFKTTLWFIKKFPKFGVILSVISIIVPLSLTLFFGFPETVLLWAVYVEAVIITLSIISVSLNFIIRSLFFNTKKKRGRNSKIKTKSDKNQTYDILRFTLF
jgi:membrane protein implicated in regulation of membrane protease activity